VLVDAKRVLQQYLLLADIAGFRAQVCFTLYKAELYRPH
jgi:hypothetical protein